MKSLVFLGCFTIAFEMMGNVGIQILIPEYFEYLDLEIHYIAYFFSVGIAGMIVGNILFGYLTDKYGYMKITRITLFLDIILFLCVGIIDNINILLPIRFFSGIINSVPSAYNMLVNNVKNNDMDKASTLFDCSMMLGPMLGMVISGILNKIIDEIRLSFIVTNVLTSISCTLAFIFSVVLEYSYNKKNETKSEVHGSSVSKETKYTVFQFILFDERIITFYIYLSSFLLGISDGSQNSFIPLILDKTYGYMPHEIATAYLIGTISMILSVILCFKNMHSYLNNKLLYLCCTFRFIISFILYQFFENMNVYLFFFLYILINITSSYVRIINLSTLSDRSKFYEQIQNVKISAKLMSYQIVCFLCGIVCGGILNVSLFKINQKYIFINFMIGSFIIGTFAYICRNYITINI